MYKSTLLSILESWRYQNQGVETMESILEWIAGRNKTVAVNIQKSSLSKSPFWFYDKQRGTIHNRNDSFFQIVGIEKEREDGTIIRQPVILQQEIGILGVICKEIRGVMHFLMQAKVEPGNGNKIQISPTIQATKSNFTQKHGGAKPPYLEYFQRASQYEIVVDQIQSEQSSRFYKKRNRNIIIRVDEKIPTLPSHKWMTLGQIKRLMRVDNLVNMDTRTVLSCIHYCKLNVYGEDFARHSSLAPDQPFFRSVFEGDGNNHFPEIYQYINNYKMFAEVKRSFVPLHELKGWKMEDNRIFCKQAHPYQVIFCNIEIEGREVRQWTQPLFEAMGIATFGLICCEQDGILKFLVRAVPELGCFDGIELGPTVQREAVLLPGSEDTAIDHFFFEKLAQGKGVFFDHLLSEEGGRFYHEQNRNVLMRIKEEELPDLPEGYFLLDYRTLNELVQVNNTLNIQLRNLLSLLEV